MSAQLRRVAEQLARNIRQNSVRIEAILRQARVEPDMALVYSAAKYYKALSKLAEE
jgi:hypothetical protein